MNIIGDSLVEDSVRVTETGEDSMRVTENPRVSFIQSDSFFGESFWLWLVEIIVYKDHKRMQDVAAIVHT